MDAWIDEYPEGGMDVAAPATENSGYFLSKELLLPFLQPFPLSGELSRPLPLPLHILQISVQMSLPQRDLLTTLANMPLSLLSLQCNSQLISILCLKVSLSLLRWFSPQGQGPCLSFLNLQHSA